MKTETTPLVYIQGLGYFSQHYASLRVSLKSLVESLNRANLSSEIVNEETNRVRILIEGLDKKSLIEQKYEIAAAVRTLCPGIKLLNSRVRGHTIWCAYFSDGNFNTYVCGFEFEMPS